MKRAVFAIGLAIVGFLLGRMLFPAGANPLPDAMGGATQPAVQTSSSSSRTGALQAPVDGSRDLETSSRALRPAVHQNELPPVSPLSSILEGLYGESLSVTAQEKYRQRVTKIQAGGVIEDGLRGFEADFEKLQGELKPIEDVAPRLTAAYSSVAETANGLVPQGAMLAGSPRSGRNDGLMRVYRSESLGVVVLTEHDARHVRLTMASEVVNHYVNGQPASIVRRQDPRTGQSMTALTWTGNGRVYSLRIGRIDDGSIAQMKAIADSIRGS